MFKSLYSILKVLLDDQGIESWWGESFYTCPDWPWRPPSRGVKWPGRGVDHHPDLGPKLRN